MDLSYFKKFFFKEDSKINVIANKIMLDILNHDKHEIKYINYFNKSDKFDREKDYYFLSFLSLKNVEILFDTRNLLNSKILNNEVNDFLTEDSILLLFLKFNVFCAFEINKLIPRKNFIDELLLEKINKYQNIFEEIDEKLLNKNLNTNEKETLLLREFKKVKISYICSQFVLSYYLFNFEEENLDSFKTFINRVEDKRTYFIKNNLNSSIDKFWNLLITNI